MGIQVLWDITLSPLENIQARFLDLENRAIKTFDDFGTSLPNITADISLELCFQYYVCCSCLV